MLKKVRAYRIFSIKRPRCLFRNRQFWPDAFWRSGFNRGTVLLMKCNFLSFFQEDLLFSDLRRPRGSLLGWDDFFLSSCPWISEDDYCTYITQSCNIMVPYILLCNIHPEVMPVFFLWAFIEIPIENNILFLVSPNSAVQEMIFSCNWTSNKRRDLEQTPGLILFLDTLILQGKLAVSTTAKIFFLLSLLSFFRLHIFIAFSPPPNFYCFLSTATITTFLFYCILMYSTAS